MEDIILAVSIIVILQFMQMIFLMFIVILLMYIKEILQELRDYEWPEDKENDNRAFQLEYLARFIKNGE